MATKKKKLVTIQYFRVLTPENTEFNLHKAAKAAHMQLCNLAERSFDRGEKRYSCLKCEV